MMYYSKRIDDGKITSVESKSVKALSPGFVEATKTEYDAFMASLPAVAPKPARNLRAELDDHEERLKKLEGRA